VSAGDNYFIAPLYVAANRDFKQVCSDIVMHGISHVALGDHSTAGITEAAETLNVTLGSDPSHYGAWIQKAQQRTEALVQRFGASPMVSLRTSLVFDSRDGNGRFALPEREFRVLMALYSYIGQKPFSQVATSKLEERAAGCKTRAMFEALKGDEWGPSYSPKEIRSAVERLHVDGEGWFSRVTWRRSRTYYSHRLQREQLIEKVAEKEAKRQRTRTSGDAALLEARVAQLLGTSGATSGQH
jgi:hypothetical protein